MIIWINGTHGVGKTTTAALVAPLLPGSRVFDAGQIGENVGVMLMDISPPLPATDNRGMSRRGWPSRAASGAPPREAEEGGGPGLAAD